MTQHTLERPPKILFLFLDGVGLGQPDPAVNPLFAASLPGLKALLGGIPSLNTPSMSTAQATVLPLDATLGVPGLPQSGTGQAALLAGFNAAKKARQHFGPFPPVSIQPVVEKKNIFRRVMAAGLRPCFANAYPQRFFDYVRDRQRRLSMTTLSCSMAGLPLRQEAELRAGEALSADITSEGWREMGYATMPVISFQEAGRRLAALASAHDFTLFEYWKTDFAGHARNMQESIAVLERFDAMLVGLLDHLDANNVLVMLSSDHGNIEDLGIKTHTRNPVPLLLFGARHQEVGERFRKKRKPTLVHVTPIMMDLLTGA